MPITGAANVGAIPTRPTCSKSSSSRGSITSTSSFGVTVTSTALPSRSTVTCIAAPARMANAFWTSGKLWTASPSMPVITSPGKSFPSAGLPGKTAPTVGGKKSRSSR